MTFGNVTPVKLADNTAKVYTSQVYYPPISGWFPGAAGNAKFYASFGDAVLTAEVVRRGVTSVYDGYFYRIQNTGYFRCKFVITDGIGADGVLTPIFDFYNGKVLAGFYKISGNNLTVQVYESVNGIAELAGDVGTVAMTEVLNVTYNATFTVANDGILYPALAMLPANPHFSWGIVSYYTYQQSGPSYISVQCFYDPLSSLLYNFGSSGSAGPFSFHTVIPLTPEMLMTWNGATYNQLLWSNGVAFSITSPDTIFNEPQDYNVASLPLDVINGMQGKQFWADSQGYFYSVFTGPPNFSLLQFDNIGNEYRQILLTGGDNQAGALIKRYADISAQNFWGFSKIGNTPLFVSGPVSNPLIYTMAPYIPLGIAGPGPKIPEIDLPCQNFCLPLSRIKKL